MFGIYITRNPGAHPATGRGLWTGTAWRVIGYGRAGMPAGVATVLARW